MANSATKSHLICGILGLFASGLVCPGAGVHPLESIVPERDLTPRNFNPHPYVSAARVALSNFDHPYTAIASKRSGYARNRLETLDNGRTTSITSLANFARNFLGLINGKKHVIENKAVVKLHDQFYGSIGISPKINVRVKDRTRKNGKTIRGKFATANGVGRGWKVPTVKDLRHELYPETLNLASVQQSSLNEGVPSFGDTNDNLSQGLYATTDDEDPFQLVASSATSPSDISDLGLLVPLTVDDDDARASTCRSRQASLTGYLHHQDWLVKDVPLYGLNSKPTYFLTSNSNHRQPRTDGELQLIEPRLYSFYRSLDARSFA